MNGIGVSPGIAIGRAFIIQKNVTALTGVLLENDTAMEAEIERFDAAVIASVDEIGAIKNKLYAGSDDEGLEILETQVEFLTDPQIREDVVKKIEAGRRNVNDAVIEVIRDTVLLFKNMEDEYMQARSADIQDIGDRILKNLNNSLLPASKSFEADTIIIAEDITPSDTLTMDVKNVIGFVTQSGGRTSHTAIIAKSKGIPAVVGCGNDLTTIQQDDIVILDGSTGTVIVNPAQDVLAEYKISQRKHLEQSAFLKKIKDVPAITIDGKLIKLTANISSGDEMEEVFDNGGEGVGLFRTELLFMGRSSFPTEEEQFEFYKKAALKSKGKPVIVRTIDIGGDKQLAYFGLPAEENPFLGYRAIRICLDRKDIFIIQLKAILRASAFGDLKIMFPMISNIQEVRAAKTILAEAKEELKNAGIKFNEKIACGIMIEIPSAAITADILAKEVDFFSIGTNDLCQYTLAVDRMNEKIKDLYDPFNPGVLRLISNVIEQAHKNNIHVGMCGEMASDPLATLLLAGMGLEEFSMSAASIPFIKNILINNNLSVAKEICQKVMQMGNSQDIKTYLKEINQ
ncbi:MAG: phosphoenolpyruvate--protein phosphotransferase [Bacteroidota bacterium]